MSPDNQWCYARIILTKIENYTIFVEVAPENIENAAFLLRAYYEKFPSRMPDFADQQYEYDFNAVVTREEAIDGSEYGERSIVNLHDTLANESLTSSRL